MIIFMATLAHYTTVMCSWGLYALAVPAPYVIASWRNLELQLNGDHLAAACSLSDFFAEKMARLVVERRATSINPHG
jgi:hypothetical protein